MRTHGMLSTLTLPLLLVLAAGETLAGASRRMEPRTVEIYKYGMHVSLNDETAVQQRLESGMVLGGHRIAAYVMVVRLDSGERFRSAKVAIKDGYFCMRSRRVSGRIVGRVLSSVGYTLLMSGVPSELQPGVSLLNLLVQPNEPVPSPTIAMPNLRKRLVLRERNVDHQQGYVTIILPIAANGLTRVAFEKIVTLKPGPRRGTVKRKAWAHAILVPGPEATALTHKQLLRALARAPATHD